MAGPLCCRGPAAERRARPLSPPGQALASGRALSGFGPLARDSSPARSDLHSLQEVGSGVHPWWGQSGQSHPVSPSPASVRCWASRMPTAGQWAAGHGVHPRAPTPHVLSETRLLWLPSCCLFKDSRGPGLPGSARVLSAGQVSVICAGPRKGRQWISHGVRMITGTTPEPAACSLPRSHVPLTSGPRTRLSRSHPRRTAPCHGAGTETMPHE